MKNKKIVLTLLIVILADRAYAQGLDQEVGRITDMIDSLAGSVSLVGGICSILFFLGSWIFSTNDERDNKGSALKSWVIRILVGLTGVGACVKIGTWLAESL